MERKRHPKLHPLLREHHRLCNLGPKITTLLAHLQPFYGFMSWQKKESISALGDTQSLGLLSHHQFFWWCFYAWCSVIFVAVCTSLGSF